MQGNQDSVGTALSLPFVLNANGQSWQQSGERQGTARSLSRRTLHSIERRDHWLMERVHAWSPPRWLRLWMMAASRAGDGGLWGFLGLLVLLFGGPDRATAVVAAACASLSGIAVFMAIKRVARRRRPYEIRTHCWAALRSSDPYSFPSGHTLTAFAVTVPLALYSPLLGIPLLFVSSSVAVSRIVLGMHFLSDVVMGFLFGCGLGYASFLLLMR